MKQALPYVVVLGPPLVLMLAYMTMMLLWHRRLSSGTVDQATRSKIIRRSQLAADYGEYRRQLFIDTLDDWQFLGPDSERPAWYTGRTWGS
jgi:hypothetical protein